MDRGNQYPISLDKKIDLRIIGKPVSYSRFRRKTDRYKIETFSRQKHKTMVLKSDAPMLKAGHRQFRLPKILDRRYRCG